MSSVQGDSTTPSGGTCATNALRRSSGYSATTRGLRTNSPKFPSSGRQVRVPRLKEASAQGQD